MSHDQAIGITQRREQRREKGKLMAEFEGKTALVTGGGTGIGRATAILLAQQGANVVIGNRNVERGEAVVEEIRAEGGTAIFQKTDVTQADEVEALVEKAVQEFGSLNLAFNNSGIEGELAKLHEQDLESTAKILDVNVMGVFTCMKYEIPKILEAGGGAIVNNSSILGTKATRDVAMYVASKHAVNGMTKSAAIDYGSKGIRINAIAPGPIETRMLTDMGEGSLDAFAKMVPMKRVGQPIEIAQPVVWLLSDQASYITGHSLIVDGGWSAT